MTIELSKKRLVLYCIIFWFVGVVSTISFLMYLNYLDENYGENDLETTIQEETIASDYVLPDIGKETIKGMKLDIDGEDPVHKLGLFHDVSKNNQDDLLVAMYYLTFISKENRADIYKKIFLISGQNGMQITQGQQLVLDMMMIKDNPDFVCEKQGEYKCDSLKSLLDMVYDKEIQEYIWNLRNGVKNSTLPIIESVKEKKD